MDIFNSYVNFPEGIPCNVEQLGEYPRYLSLIFLESMEISWPIFCGLTVLLWLLKNMKQLAYTKCAICLNRIENASLWIDRIALEHSQRFLGKMGLDWEAQKNGRAMPLLYQSQRLFFRDKFKQFWTWHFQLEYMSKYVNQFRESRWIRSIDMLLDDRLTYLDRTVDPFVQSGAQFVS